MSGADDIAAAIGGAGPLDPPAPNERELADLPRNDLGNAARLIARHGHDLRKVDDVGWFVFDRKRWEAPLAKEAPAAVKRAHLTSQAIADEARALEPDVTAAEAALPRLKAEGRGEEGNEAVKSARERWLGHRKFGVSCGNSARLSNMLSEAAPDLRLVRGALDADPWLLNVDNGTLELDGRHLPPVKPGRPPSEAGDCVRLRPHDRADFMTHLVPIAWDKEADCPRFRRFLEEAQTDREMRAFLQRLIGYCASGSTVEQMIVVMHGKGANGKSTFLRAISAALGDYALSLPIETFLRDERRRGGDATPDLARLPGARLVMASEPEQGAELSEALIKITTGDEKMTARPLYAGMFEFVPMFKLIISANERPVIRAGDDGTWRRIRLVHWPVSFRGREDRTLLRALIGDPERAAHAATPELRRRFQGELPGILNWVLDGVRLYREFGLAEPKEVLEATQRYRSESDPIGEFLRYATANKTGGAVQAGRLYELYQRWSQLNGVKPWSGTAFGRALADRGYPKSKSSIVFREGLELVEEAVKQIEGATPPATAREGSLAW